MIYIYLDKVDKDISSYNEVKELLKQECEVIHTYCLTFFSLQYGEAVIIKGDKQITLSKLMNNEKGYTVKMMRPSLNTYKMLVAGCFNFIEDVP